MKEDKPIQLRAAPPKPVLMNKPLLIIVGILLIGLFLFAFIEALSEKPAEPKKSETSQEAMLQSKKEITNTLSKLPNDYTDQAAINQFSHHALPVQAPLIPQAVQDELNALRQQQAELENRLQEASVQQHAQSPSNQDLQNHQALTSGLFFPGSAPSEQNKNAASSNSGSSSASNGSGGAGAAGKETSYEQQNMQSQKISFLKPSDEDEGIYDEHRLVKPASPYEVQAGTIIPTALITGVNSSLPGSVVAQVQHDIYDSVSGRYLLIPKGSKILGKYDSKVAYGQERILLAFDRIIRPDGSSIQLTKFQGIDMAGQAGVQGDVNNHWSRILGAATISTLLSFGAGAASDNMGNNNTYYRSSEQNAALGAAQNVSSIGQDLTGRAINIQPTIQLPPGYPFNVVVKKDMVMEPYHPVPVSADHE
ncbi:MAG: hypothetical protein KKA99_03265 [Gammaproteobacteria bacterium]|nr:hypothetical protein [Gammaproteobacteria bacterium]